MVMIKKYSTSSNELQVFMDASALHHGHNNHGMGYDATATTKRHNTTAKVSCCHFRHLTEGEAVATRNPTLPFRGSVTMLGLNL
jgi:hypothetical protein